MVARANAFRREDGRNVGRAVQYVRIPVLFYVVLVVNDEGYAVGRTVRPLLDPIEDPSRSRRKFDVWA